MCKSCLGEFNTPDIAAKWLRGQTGTQPVSYKTSINAGEFRLPAKIQLPLEDGS